MPILPHRCLPGLAAIAAGVLVSAWVPAAQASESAAPLVVLLDHVPVERSVDRKHRTPETIDHALAADLAHRLQRPLSAVPADSPQAALTSSALRLTTLAAPAAVPSAIPAGFVAIPVRYDAAQMAIMRTDTTIKRWEDLKGRTVCVSREGTHVGTLAAQFGAIEKVYPAAADSLIGVRVGDCDAAVADTALLKELILLPEWKKFSARLPARESRALAFLVPASDARTVAAVRKATQDWKTRALPAALMKNAVRNIAFEVYLEQDVPDCH